MPNGGSDNCWNCHHNSLRFDREHRLKDVSREDRSKAGFCRIRGIPIPRQSWTYCANNGSENEIPEGPVYGPDLNDRRIPWYANTCPSTGVSGICSVCGDSFELGIGFENEERGVRRFCGSAHYVRWWKAGHPDTTLVWDEGHESAEVRGTDTMLGPIAGDIIGSAYEASGYKHYDFDLFSEYSRFTDDTVMTVAVAAAILDGEDYATSMRRFGQRHPLAGYGLRFQEWVLSPDLEAYGSWGNGAAMRVAPIGLAGGSEDWVLEEARKSAEVSHDHPEAIRGAQAIALATFLARTVKDKGAIRAEIADRFGYDLDRTVEKIRPNYSFDASCQGSVPESIVCFLEGTDFESTIRNAVSLGGDTDTMACMAAGIAQAFYGGLPEEIAKAVESRLPEEFLQVIARFNREYG